MDVAMPPPRGGSGTEEKPVLANVNGQSSVNHLDSNSGAVPRKEVPAAEPVAIKREGQQGNGGDQESFYEADGAASTAGSATVGSFTTPFGSPATNFGTPLSSYGQHLNGLASENGLGILLRSTSEPSSEGPSTRRAPASSEDEDVRVRNEVYQDSDLGDIKIDNIVLGEDEFYTDEDEAQDGGGDGDAERSAEEYLQPLRVAVDNEEDASEADDAAKEEDVEAAEEFMQPVQAQTFRVKADEDHLEHKEEEGERVAVDNGESLNEDIEAAEDFMQPVQAQAFRVAADEDNLEEEHEEGGEEQRTVAPEAVTEVDREEHQPREDYGSSQLKIASEEEEEEEEEGEVQVEEQESAGVVEPQPIRVVLGDGGDYDEEEVEEEGEIEEGEEYGSEDEYYEDEDEEEGDEEVSEQERARAEALAALAAATGGVAPRPAGGLGALPTLPERPAPRARAGSSSTAPVAPTPPPPVEENLTPEARKLRQKLDTLRVSLLRLSLRMGHGGARLPVVANVLYRMQIAEQMKMSGNGVRMMRPMMGQGLFQQAQATAEQLETEQGPNSPLDVTCTILLLGKTGVGKSATMNSILDQPTAPTSAFERSTTKIREVVGTVYGAKVRFIDTPGLETAGHMAWKNDKLMKQIKNYAKGSRKPDLVLYVDRLDVVSRSPKEDALILRSITNALGAAVWLNALIVMTHAATAPPEDVRGQLINYDMFVQQRMIFITQAVREITGEGRLQLPQAAVDNHPNCRTNRDGEKVLPNGIVWKPQMLIVAFALKVIADANKVLNLEEPSQALGGGRMPNLFYFLGEVSVQRNPVPLPRPWELLDTDASLEQTVDRAQEASGATVSASKQKKSQRPPVLKVEYEHTKQILDEASKEVDHPLDPLHQNDPEYLRFRRRDVSVREATNGFNPRYRHETDSTKFNALTLNPAFANDHDHEEEDPKRVAFAKYDVLLDELPVVANGYFQCDKEGRAGRVNAAISKWYNPHSGSTFLISTTFPDNMYGAHFETVIGQGSKLYQESRDEGAAQKPILNQVTGGASFMNFDSTKMFGVKLSDRVQRGRLHGGATIGLLKGTKGAGLASGFALQAGHNRRMGHTQGALGIQKWRGAPKFTLGIANSNFQNYGGDYHSEGFSIDSEGKGRIRVIFSKTGNLLFALPFVWTSVLGLYNTKGGREVVMEAEEDY